jgi:hypothetical protein
MATREQCWHWIKRGDEWRPAYYSATLAQNSPGLAWWIDDSPVKEERIEAIGPRIRTPDEFAGKNMRLVPVSLLNEILEGRKNAETFTRLTKIVEEE